MNNKLESRVIKNFGPSVLKVKIPENMISMINQYIDGIIIDKKKTKDLNAGDNLVGDVTQEFSLETEFIKKSGWGVFLGSCVNKWIEFETKKRSGNKNRVEGEQVFFFGSQKMEEGTDPEKKTFEFDFSKTQMPKHVVERFYQRRTLSFYWAKIFYGARIFYWAKIFDWANIFY